METCTGCPTERKLTYICFLSSGNIVDKKHDLAKKLLKTDKQLFAVK